MSTSGRKKSVKGDGEDVGDILPSKVFCPFTGAPVEIKQVAGGLYWMGSVSTPDGGYTTRLFDSKRELVFFLCKRDGKDPGFSRRPRIVVGEAGIDKSARESYDEKPEQQRRRDLDEMATNFVGAVSGG